jgi:hypothetical protein
MATRKSAPVEPKRGRGRPTHYDPAKHPEQARKLALLGCDDKEIADVLGISVRALNAWKGAHPDFQQSLTRGKTAADADVAASMYERACGYSHPAVKILQHEGVPIVVPYTEHYPPDTPAAAIWLANRRRGKWSRTPSPEAGDDTPAPVRVVVTVKDASRPDGEG